MDPPSPRIAIKMPTAPFSEMILPRIFDSGSFFRQASLAAIASCSVLLYKSNSKMIVQHFDRPSLFKTFTTDPEITRELLTDENGKVGHLYLDRGFQRGPPLRGIKLIFDVQEEKYVHVRKTAPLEFDGQTLTIYLPYLHDGSCNSRVISSQ
jgi:hypothetical protein